MRVLKLKGERQTVMGRRIPRTKSAAQVKREAEDAQARRRWLREQEALEAALLEIEEAGWEEAEAEARLYASEWAERHACLDQDEGEWAWAGF